MGEQDAHLTSSTFWTWKERGGGWSLFDGPPPGAPVGAPNGPVRPDYLEQLSRVLPLATAGRLDSFAYNTTIQVFAMSATAPAGGVDGAARGTPPPTPPASSLVYIPAHIARPDSDLAVGGSARLAGVERQPDGSRLVTVAVRNDGGGYTVRLG